MKTIWTKLSALIKKSDTGFRFSPMAGPPVSATISYAANISSLNSAKSSPAPLPDRPKRLHATKRIPEKIFPYMSGSKLFAEMLGNAIYITPINKEFLVDWLEENTTGHWSMIETAEWGGDKTIYFQNHADQVHFLLRWSGTNIAS